MTTRICTSSYNLSKEWKQCCWNAMGLSTLLLNDEDYNTNHSLVQKEQQPQQQQQQQQPTTISSSGVGNKNGFQLINLLNNNNSMIEDDEDFDDDYDENDYDDNSEEEKDDYYDNNNNNSNNTNNTWMQSAIQVQDNLRQMSLWIQSKQVLYETVSLSDNDASLIQSTIMSFIATTANEIESLDTMIEKFITNNNSRSNNNNNNNQNQNQNQNQQSNQQSNQQYKAHCHGIVQILMNQLKETIIQPFTISQKYRKRTAVTIWQNPLCCNYSTIIVQLQLQLQLQQQQQQIKSATKSSTIKQSTTATNNNNKNETNTSTFDQLLVDDDDDDSKDNNTENEFEYPTNKKFIPTRPTHKLNQDFYSSYSQQQSSSSLKKPKSIFSHNQDNDSITSTASEISHPSSTTGFTFGIGTNSTSASTTYPQTKKHVVKASSLLHKTNDKSKLTKVTTTTSTTTASAANTIASSNKYIHNNIKLQQKSSNDTNDYENDTNNTNTNYNFVVSDEELKKESILLQEVLVKHSELDSISHMETMMIDITTLLNQFTELAFVQSDNVYDIQQTINDTKDNIDSGIDQLIDATERIQSSKHYMATIIFILSCILLIFHWLRP